MSKYKQTVTVAAGTTRQVRLVSDRAVQHVLQVDGPGTARVRASINEAAGLHDFGELKDTLVTTAFPGLELWEITASEGEVTVTVCGD